MRIYDYLSTRNACVHVHTSKQTRCMTLLHSNKPSVPYQILVEHHLNTASCPKLAHHCRHVIKGIRRIGKTHAESTHVRHCAHIRAPHAVNCDRTSTWWSKSLWHFSHGSFCFRCLLALRNHMDPPTHTHANEPSNAYTVFDSTSCNGLYTMRAFTASGT
jgi:hypothetical protein